jgi:hypothetical protein
MEEEKADFTLCFRSLSKALIGDGQTIRALFNNSRRFDGESEIMSTYKPIEKAKMGPELDLDL